METTVAVPPRSPGADRFLIGILAGIGVLLLLAVVAVFLLRQPVTQLAADTPGGTVQRFLQALERREYDRAYDYLADSMANKPTREDFTRYNADRFASGQVSTRMRIESESISGENATVVVTITSTTTGTPFFNNSWTTSDTFALRHVGTDWRITSLPYEYWPPYGIR